MPKTAKYKDYFEKEYPEASGVTISNAFYPFVRATADGIEVLEVSKSEWQMIVAYFLPKNDWDKKTIWGIKLKIIQKDE